MGTLWTRKIGGKNAHVYVYVYGYKVRLHVYENCVNVAALLIIFLPPAQFMFLPRQQIKQATHIITPIT